jgi:hypothetical protein
MREKYRTITSMNSGITRIGFILALSAITAYGSSCGRLDDAMQGINPPYVINRFFESWKKRDWKTLYTLVHSNFIQQIRLQRLSPKEKAMSDEELFIHQFEVASEKNPGKVLRSYSIISITPYTPGDTTVWADTIVNGRKKLIPITIDRLTLKVDLTRIK